MWQTIAQIRTFAARIIEEKGNVECLDEWHQFEEAADVHLQIAAEPDAYGIYEINITAYPLETDEAGNKTTDTSNGILLF